MRYETIILDFDGTIVDTRKSIIETVRETLKCLGHSLKDETEVGKMIGLPLSTTFEKVAGIKGGELDLAIKEYRVKYPDIALDLIELFPTVKETLKVIHNNGFKLAIASNRGKEILNNLLEKFEIKHFFWCIIGEQDVENKKPAPDAVNLILKKLKKSSKDALIVGDTIYDIEMGKRAFCKTCAVTYGNGTFEELKAASPDFLIKNFSRLLNIIEI